jgi:hypothetical protein
MIIWTLNFTVKGFIFGAVSSTGLIKTSITNIFNEITSADTIQFNMGTSGVGTYQVGEIVYQGYSLAMSTASAKVVYYNNNTLQLTEINGNFVSNQPIIGSVTNANYTFTSYQVQPLKYAEIVVVPNPTDADANSAYTYTTVISEPIANSANVVIPTNTSYDIDLTTENKYIDLL